MKIKVAANELVDANISMVSLVKHGANRSPFKIIKSEDGESDVKELTIGKKIAKAFGIEKPAKPLAFFIRKGAEDAVLPKFKEAGFKVDPEEIDGVIVLKQDGYAEDKVKGLIHINEDVGVAFDQDIVKGCYLYETFESFEDTLSSNSFGPSLSQGIDALYMTVWKALDNSRSQEEAAGKIDAALVSFRKYVNELVKALPQTIFKFDEKNLRKEIGASTVNANGEDPVMKDAKLKEAAPGDLDGLDLVEKDETKGAPKVEPKVEKADDKSVKKDETKAEGEAVEKADETEPTDEPKKETGTGADVLAQLATSMAALAETLKKSQETQAEVNAKVLERLDAIEKKDSEKVEKADEPKNKRDVQVIYKGDADLDQSLATLSSHSSLKGKEVKKGDDLWSGSALDIFG